LRFGSFANQGTLAAGTWQVEMWIYDTSNPGTQIIGYQTHDSLGTPLGETILSTAIEPNPTDPAITFNLQADGASFYSVFSRENSTLNRSRLNAVRITSITLPGDFDADGDVDGADFVTWQTNFPATSGATLAQGDADGDFDVDGADFAAWQGSFPAPASAAFVPEPSAFLLALLSLPAIGCTVRRRLG
jgi:hypothetical protein